MGSYWESSSRRAIVPRDTELIERLLFMVGSDAGSWGILYLDARTGGSSTSFNCHLCSEWFTQLGIEKKVASVLEAYLS